MLVCNNTLEHQKIEEVPYFLNGRYTFHQVGLVVCACTGLAACLIAGYLVLQHGRHYSLPQEQRHIIRILFMIPVYAIVAFLSYVYYTKAIYYDVLGDCWEAFAIASFFTLMCSYLRQGLHEQKVYFRERPRPKNWIWPINWLQKCTGGQDRGLFRRPRNALTWFNIIYLCIFQYCFIRVFFTIVSVITQVFNRYCEDSLNPAFAHVWVTCFEGASVSIAMYALIQFYYELKTDLARHKPFLKLLCIKLVIFLSFWQTLIISFLASSSHGLISPGPRVGYNDIHVGIPSLLLCIEMALFAILHLWAFPYRRPYTKAAELAEHTALSNTPVSFLGNGNGYGNGSAMMTGDDASSLHTTTVKQSNGASDHPPYLGGPLGVKALIDALNPWDIIKATGRGFRWLFIGVKKRNDPLNLTTLGKVVVDPEPNLNTDTDGHLPMHTAYTPALGGSGGGAVGMAAFPPIREQGRGGYGGSQDEGEGGRGGGKYNPNRSLSVSPIPRSTTATPAPPYPTEHHDDVREGEEDRRGLLGGAAGMGVR